MYWAWASITTQIARIVFLLFTLVLSFLLYPALTSQRRSKVHWTSWVLVALSVIALGYPIVDFEEFIYRSATPNVLDQVLGALTILLVLEASRRSTAFDTSGRGDLRAGLRLARSVSARAMDTSWLRPAAIVGHMYMTLEGIFGSALDVAATFILLFGIYGSALNYSKASEFFMNLSLALTRGKPTSGGRAVTLASFLLGGPSGSGVATTVTLGSVVWPLLAKAGYAPAAAGGLLAAGGIGATLSPPVLGAAAFLISEFLKISYFEVIVMAIIPTILYYWSVLWMVEFDAKRMGTKAISTSGETAAAIIRKDGYHFVSLLAVVVFMMFGMSATLAVIYAILLAIVMSFVRPASALGPRRLWRTMESGATSTLSVAATCAAAGIIVGVVTLTGLRLKFSSIVACRWRATACF